MSRPAGMGPKEYRALCQRAQALHSKHPDCRRKEAADFLVYVVVVVTLLLAVRLVVAEPIWVDGSSMSPTLAEGERLAVEKVSYCFRTPQRGEIVICHYPGEWKNYVKRVIGLPGETVEIVYGVVYIDGAPLEEDAYWPGITQGDMQAVTVPQNALFVMGDNRRTGGSVDSRDPDVGPIPLWWAGCWPFGGHGKRGRRCGITPTRMGRDKTKAKRLKRALLYCGRNHAPGR